MSESNNIEEMLKQTMEILAKQQEEIANLKEAKNEAVAKPKTIPVKHIDETQQLNPFEVVASEKKAKEDMKKQVEEEYKVKEILSSFDTKYSKYLQKESLDDINLSNADERHKTVEKFARIFQQESNIELIPSFLKDDVKHILSLNDTEKAKYDDINKIDMILGAFSEIKDKMDITKTKFFGNNKFGNNNIPQNVSKSVSNWKKAIEEKNQRILKTA